VGLKLNERHQLPVYANVNLLGGNINTIKKNTETFHQNARQNHDMKTTNRCFESVAQFRYLGMTVTNQNLIEEEIKRRLNLDNACYYSIQTLLSSRLLPRNIKIKINKTIILPVVLYGCETWSLTSREKRRLRVFENRVLRRIFGPKRDEVTDGGENCIMRSFITCSVRQV
jgi:hypothetical protein